MNYFSKHIAKYQEGGQISNEQLDQLVDVFLQRPDLFALASEQTIGEDGPINNEIVDRVTHMTDEQKIQLKDNIKSDKQFCNILVQLFPAVQELANSEPQTMKNGGKTEYLKTLKGATGVTIPKKQDFDESRYNVVINAPGDTLYTKPYKYRTEYRQTYPNGAVRYDTLSGSNYEMTSSWDPNGTKPTFWQRLSWGRQTASPELLENWRELMQNHKGDTNIKDKTKKK